MSRLDTRLRRLEQRRPAAEICPEHPAPTGAASLDYRDGLDAFSPDPDERAAYHARQDALEAQPPCPRCGWKPFAIRVRAVANWGWPGPTDGDAA